MGGALVPNCCFYWDLRTGGKIIGWIWAVFAVLGMLGLTYTGFFDSQRHVSGGEIVTGFIVGLIYLAISVLLIMGAEQVSIAY